MTPNDGPMQWSWNKLA